ncbi:hypothetical protein SVA_0193 [Sulfurifustis variabilis]|uniref:DUF4198 domain-containing protein n=1 Tax=Sulfurifustis variabilis TaxID=1675686 RepID=A0A1B4V0P1_9GAMM|nr:hypothetical protein [Sulfurifustis variabilis]BAU46775.1 hypothetical protein SVA_0193 [Sulfurifustis variabilis]
MRALLLLLSLATPSAILAQQEPGHEHHDHASHGAPPAGVDAIAWTKDPLLVPARGERGDRQLLRLVPRNFEPAAISVLGPAEDSRPEHVAVRANGVEFRAPRGNGNYYWASARTESGDEVLTASTVHYFSNPGPAPRALLARPKGELELIPQRLPREHAQYREGEEWPFVVRFRGQPLAGAVVALRSEHGTMDAFRTDEAGVARVRFPRDMTRTAPAAAGHAHHGRPRAAFVVSVDHRVDGRRYLTAFNYTYAPHAYDGKHLGAGIGFALLGGLLAAPIVRHARKRS